MKWIYTEHKKVSSTCLLLQRRLFLHSKCHVHNWFFIYTLAIAKTTITESKGVDQHGCQRPRLQIKPLAIQKPTHQKPICLLMSALSTAHITQNRDRRNKNTSVSLFANTFVTCLPHVTCLILRQISKLLIVSHALDHCNEVSCLDMQPLITFML